MLKKRTLTKTGLLMALLAAITWFGCAQKIRIYGIKPAEISMGGIKTLAILKFAGKYGEMVRGDFYSKLDEVKHFTLIDTTAINKLDSVRYEQIDDPRFIPLFQDLHADGVIMGRVTAEINDIKGTDQVQKQEGTGQYKEGKDIFGSKTQVEVMKTVLKPAPFVVRQASVTCDFKVFELKSRRILATSKVTKSFKDKFGGDSWKDLGDLPSKDENANSLSSQVAAELVIKIAPTKFSKDVEMEGAGHKMIKRGIDYAKGGSMQEAMEVWLDVTRAEPANPAAYYNLGVGYESYGDLASLKKAKDYYKKADQIKPKKLYVDGINRVNQAIKDREKYDQQKQMLDKTPTQKSGGTGGIRVY
jgi:hypothetical protein